MTKETKNLFDAPFAVMGDSTDHTKFNVIIHYRKSPRYCSTVASCIDQKTAIRFARLPELYDALVEVAYEHCQLCIYKNSESASKMPSPNDMATNGGASFCFQNCPRLKHWKLLKKMGDGE